MINIWFCEYCGSGNAEYDLKCQGCSHPITKECRKDKEEIFTGTFEEACKKLVEAFSKLAQMIMEWLIPVIRAFTNVVETLLETQEFKCWYAENYEVNSP